MTANKSPKPSRKRGLHYLLGGLLGSVAIASIFSFAFDDWSYLSRWLGGLAALAIALIYLFFKKWLVRQAIHQVQSDVQPNTKENHDHAGNT